MPNRILREGILGSRAVNSLSESGEIFYRRLISVVDDYGRCEADLDLLRARMFPLCLDRWPLSRVKQVLAEVCECLADDEQGIYLVCHYDTPASKNKKYLQIYNFKQQTRSSSKFPAPSDTQMRSTCLADAQHMHTKTETESETESYPYPGANGAPKPPMMPPVSQSEFPLTIAEIRKHDPAVDDIFVLRLVQQTTQALLSHSKFPQDKVPKATVDKIIARACKESYATGPREHKTGLLLSRVPPILITWGLEPEK